MHVAHCRCSLAPLGPPSPSDAHPRLHCLHRVWAEDYTATTSPPPSTSRVIGEHTATLLSLLLLQPSPSVAMDATLKSFLAAAFYGPPLSAHALLGSAARHT